MLALILVSNQMNRYTKINLILIMETIMTTKTIQIISTDNAPSAIGPYSQATKANGFVFCSGQIALDPKTGTLVGDDVETQTKQVLKNLEAVLLAAGSGFEHVVKTTIFLKDMADFKAVNDIYSTAFSHHKPARATVAAAGLPMDVLVEIECVALG